MVVSDQSSLNVLQVLSVNASATISVIGKATIRTVAAQFAAGSLISGIGAGYASSLGPGTPSGGSNGAHHAGCGSQGGCSTASTGTNVAYGDTLTPVLPGSGGSSGSAGGGAGGAALILIVTGTLSFNGTIDVSGAAGGATGCYQCWGGGGGSGGSILINASSLAPSFGTLRSNGGNGGTGYSSNHGQGGSGGRISVICGGAFFGASTTYMTATANGAYNPSTPALVASGGTIYTNCGTTRQSLRVGNAASNSGLRETYVLVSSSSSLNTTFASIDARNFASVSTDPWPAPSILNCQPLVSLADFRTTDRCRRFTVCSHCSRTVHWRLDRALCCPAGHISHTGTDELASVCGQRLQLRPVPDCDATSSRANKPVLHQPCGHQHNGPCRLDNGDALPP